LGTFFKNENALRRQDVDLLAVKVGGCDANSVDLQFIDQGIHKHCFAGTPWTTQQNSLLMTYA
jgi:hypothetical protein